MMCNPVFLFLASTFFTCSFALHVKSCRIPSRRRQTRQQLLSTTVLKTEEDGVKLIRHQCRQLPSQMTMLTDNRTGSMISINQLNVQPEPVSLPGTLTLSGSVTFHKPLTGNLDADLTVSRRFWGMWIDLPCVNTPKGRLGSCVYTNICGNIMRNGRQCPGLLADNGIPCTCPVPAQTYTVQSAAIPLNLSSLNIPAFAVAGDYQASLRVTDKDTMLEIICLDFFVEIAEAERSSNRFGSIGGLLINLIG